MAERRDNIMKVKMPLSSISFYLFILTLLDVAVKSQMSSNSNSHSFIQENSDVRYLVDNIPVSVHKEFSSSPGVRVQNGKDSIAVYNSGNGGGGTSTSASSSSGGSSTTNGANGASASSTGSKAYLKFEPSILDFKERHLGMPHHEKVTILNLDRNKTIHMTSISGSTVHFHSSFFEDKIIPPLGNTSFNVVFLGREEGIIESCLFIHTSEGSFKYDVKGASIQSPYRLRPLSNVRLPLNASYSPLIQMHNPHSTTLQLVEVYSSGGEFHLELPSGELEGPKHLWEIPAFLTKPVIRVRFHARAQKNYTAYIRLKVNNSEEVLVVPLEVEVSSSAGLYCPDDVIDFGIGGSQDPPKQMRLMLRNSWKKPIRVQNVISTPVSKSLKIDFEPVKVPPDANSATQVATLTFDWQAGLESGLMSGRIVVKSKQGNQKLIIPYTATVLIGGLLFDKQITKFRSDLTESYVEPRHFYLTNSYKVPVAITNISLQTDKNVDCNDENSFDVNSAINYFQLDNFLPVILQPNEKKKIVELSIRQGVTLPPDLKLESKLLVQSNISTLSVPLLCYDGRLDTVIHPTGNETELHLGMVGSESIKDSIIAVINNNPVPVTLNSWGTSLTGGTVRLIAMVPGNKTTFLSGGGTAASYQENYTSLQPESVIHPKHYAVFHLEVVAGQNPGLLDGLIWIRTEFETIKIHSSFEIQHGSLIVEPQPILFNNCFPGKICMEPLSVRSHFTVGMTVTGVSSVPADRRFSYTASSPLVAPSSTSHLGLLSWDAEEGDFSYLGIKNNTMGWVQPDLGSTTDLPAYTKETDLNLLTERYNSFINMSSQPLNLSLRLDTTQVRDLKFKATVKLTWPRLIQNNVDHIKFPLTQVGNVSLEDIVVVNPAMRHSLLVQIVLETGYPMANGIINSIPERLRPVCTDCTNTNSDEFFIVMKEQEESLMSSQMSPPPSFSSSGGSPHSFILSKRDVSFLIPPASNISLTLGFLPSSAQQRSALLFIRNNLTVLELVQLSGVGAYAQFKFGNRRPGSGTPLLFELADKHLRDCEREKHRKYPAPNLTVKRSFTARNTGALPITIHGFHISGLPCEGYGFRVLNCEPFHLPPNSTRKVDIAFTPDFTLARVQRTLSIWMSNEAGSAANYTLVATLPPYLLATCSSVLARPTWEPLLYYSAVTFMIFLLVCVLAAAFLESDRVLKHALLAMSQDSSVQPVLDLRLVAAGFNQTSSHNNGWNGSCEQQVKMNDPDTSVKKKLLANGNSSSGVLSNMNSNSVNKRNTDASESCLHSSNVNLLSSSMLLGNNDSLQQRRGSWASMLNNRSSCQTSQVPSNSCNSNAASLQKQVVINSNNLKTSNNSYNNNNNSNTNLNSSTSSNDNNRVDLHQNLTLSSSISQTTGNHNHGGTLNSSKCSTLPVVPILRASDLNSVASSSSTKRNKSSSSNSSSSSLSSSSSFSSLNNNSSSNKCNNKKNNSNSNGLNGVSKRLLDIALFNSTNSCNNDDIETSSTNTDSSSSQDDCEKDETVKHRNDNIDSRYSQNSNSIKCNSNKQCRNNKNSNNNYDNINKKTDNNKNNCRITGGSVSSLEGDEDDSNDHMSSTASITTQSSSGSGLSNLSALTLSSSSSSSLSSLSTSSGGIYPNNNNTKKSHTSRNLRRNANANLKSNKNNTSEINTSSVSQPGILNTSSGNLHSNKQPSNSSCIRQENIKQSNNGSSGMKNSGGIVGTTINAIGNSAILRNKDKMTPIKRRPMNDKLNLVLNTPSSTGLSHSNKDLTSSRITPPPISTVRASFSDVVARTSSVPVSGIRLPSSSSSGLSSPLSPSSLSSTSSSETSNGSSGLGPIGPKKSGRGDLLWLDQPSGSQSSLNTNSSLFSLEQKSSFPLSQVQSGGNTVWSDTVSDSGAIVGPPGSSLGIGPPSNTNSSASNSLVLKALQEVGQRQQAQPAFKETWPSVDPFWDSSTLCAPSTSPSTSTAPASQLSVGSPVSPVWGSRVWTPPTAPWAPPGITPHPPPRVNPTAVASDLSSDTDQGTIYNPFGSLIMTSIWSPTPNIWQPPTTK